MPESCRYRRQHRVALRLRKQQSPSPRQDSGRRVPRVCCAAVFPGLLPGYGMAGADAHGMIEHRLIQIGRQDQYVGGQLIRRVAQGQGLLIQLRNGLGERSIATGPVHDAQPHQRHDRHDPLPLTARVNERLASDCAENAQQDTTRSRRSGPQPKHLQLSTLERNCQQTRQRRRAAGLKSANPGCPVAAADV